MRVERGRPDLRNNFDSPGSGMTISRRIDQAEYRWIENWLLARLGDDYMPTVDIRGFQAELFGCFDRDSVDYPSWNIYLSTASISLELYEHVQWRQFCHSLRTEICVTSMPCSFLARVGLEGERL